MSDFSAGEPSWLAESGNKLVNRTRALGEQTAFYGRSLVSTGDAIRRYPGEVLRLIAVMGMGTGALAVIGGTVVIIGFLTLSTGALIAVQGYNTLSNVGIEALTGFLSAFLNVRFIAPATAGVALAATIAPAPPRSWVRCESTRRSTPWR
jgi:phospholipid/cholesterol/gamma-HCH transport system permease protein